MAENKVLKKCKCGCGKLTNYGSVWIQGHNTRNMSEKTKRKMSLARQNVSEETRNKLSIAGIGNTNAKGSKRSEEHKRKISISAMGNTNMLGKKHSEETKIKQSISAMGNTNVLGHKFSDGHKFNISKAMKKISQQLSESKRKNWQDPDYQKMQSRARDIKPNRPEQYLIKLLNDLFLNEYRYVGDFQFWLGGKCPDFMNVNGQKKLIELYGDYWHRNDNPQNRIDHFKQYGFNTLVIWEHELKNRLTLKSKLMNFHRI